MKAAGEKGLLDGLTILRYAHALERGGGMEEYLVDLNGLLSTRNKLLTIQMRLTLDKEQTAEKDGPLHRGRLLDVPLFVADSPAASATPMPQPRRFIRRFRNALTDRLLCTPWLNRFVACGLLGNRKVPRRAGEPTDLGRRAEEIFQKHKIDLLVLHAAGGADVSDLIERARRRGVPILLSYHFANERLNGLSIRQQTCYVDWIGGASAVGMPRYLRDRFSNLSDAVDTDFYSPELARQEPDPSHPPILYTPARLTPSKGQADVIRVAAELARRNLRTRVVFAGRVESERYADHLVSLAKKEGLADDVKFLGPLSLDEYRSWYGKAAVTLLLTQHHEGMPRTVIDSQAMEVPPIVSEMGGTREGLRHGETGILISRGDLKGATEAGESLLRDPVLRARMGKAGRQFVIENFSQAAFAHRHEQLYLDIIERSRARISN